MTKVTAVLVFLFVVLLQPALAGTKIGYNCTEWNATKQFKDADLELLMKTFFVRGIYEGAFVTEAGAKALVDKSELEKDQRIRLRQSLSALATSKYFTAADYPALISRVDLFCNDDRNSNVWIIYALVVASMELRGDDTNDIDKVASEFRRILSNPEHKVNK